MKSLKPLEGERSANSSVERVSYDERSPSKAQSSARKSYREEGGTKPEDSDRKNRRAQTYSAGKSRDSANQNGSKDSARAPTKASGRKTMSSKQAPMRSAADEMMAKVIAREELRTQICELGGGSLLRGWRRELDPDGTLLVPCKEVASCCKRLNFSGNVADLTCGAQSLTLEELASEDGQSLNRFRNWMKENFGGPAEMFEEFDIAQITILTFDAFQRGCKRSRPLCQQGYPHMKELRDIYSCCDPDDAAEVRKEDLMFLETDPVKRSADMAKKAGAAQKDKYKKMQAEGYADGMADYPAHHRCAGRPWMAVIFAELPSVVCSKREDRRNKLDRDEKQNKVAFIKHLRKQFGNEVRAWRRELDKEGAFSIPFKDFANFCLRFEVDVNARSLWKAIDGDRDDCLRLEEVAPVAADVLAKFQLWARNEFGSATAMWDQPASVEARAAAAAEFDKTQNAIAQGWRPQQSPTTSHTEAQSQSIRKFPSRKKMPFQALSRALKELGWPGMDDPDIKHSLYSSLDIYGLGLVERSDLEWLDKWEPAQWIVAEADPDALQEFKELLLRKYQHPLVAWRRVLDIDNSNSVSWTEFNVACDKVRWKGNIGGAWRQLDDDMSGAISMKEYDLASAELLESFKLWADENFGSVRSAFRTLDETKLGNLSFSVLKKACRRLRWSGDVRLLFDCLGTQDGAQVVEQSQGKRSLSLKDISFLDSWATSASDPADGELEELQGSFGDVKRTNGVPIGASRALDDPSMPIGAHQAACVGRLYPAPTRKILGSKKRFGADPFSCEPSQMTFASTSTSRLPAVSDKASTMQKSASAPSLDWRVGQELSSPHSRTQSLWDFGPVLSLSSQHRGSNRQKMRIYGSSGHSRSLRNLAQSAYPDKMQAQPWLQRMLLED